MSYLVAVTHFLGKVNPTSEVFRLLKLQFELDKEYCFIIITVFPQLCFVFVGLFVVCQVF